MGTLEELRPAGTVYWHCDYPQPHEKRLGYNFVACKILYAVKKHVQIGEKWVSPDDAGWREALQPIAIYENIATEMQIVRGDRYEFSENIYLDENWRLDGGMGVHYDAFISKLLDDTQNDKAVNYYIDYLKHFLGDDIFLIGCKGNELEFPNLAKSFYETRMAMNPIERKVRETFPELDPDFVILLVVMITELLKLLNSCNRTPEEALMMSKTIDRSLSLTKFRALKTINKVIDKNRRPMQMFDEAAYHYLGQVKQVIDRCSVSDVQECYAALKPAEEEKGDSWEFVHRYGR